MRYRQKERNSKFFKKYLKDGITFTEIKFKILRFYLHENVQLISCVYSKMTCVHGAELADGDLIFVFLLERI